MRRSAVVTTGLLVMSGMELAPASAAETPCLDLTTFQIVEPTIVGTNGPDVLRGTEGVTSSSASGATTGSSPSAVTTSSAAATTSCSVRVATTPSAARPATT
jgi:hypothetical protein